MKKLLLTFGIFAYALFVGVILAFIFHPNAQSTRAPMMTIDTDEWICTAVDADNNCKVLSKL